jgi:hypothetical protein
MIEAVPEGADLAFLKKPVNLDKLAVAIASLTRPSRQRGAALICTERSLLEPGAVVVPPPTRRLRAGTEAYEGRGTPISRTHAA